MSNPRHSKNVRLGFRMKPNNIDLNHIIASENIIYLT